MERTYGLEVDNKIVRFSENKGGMPLFWNNEITGYLKEVVKKFFKKLNLTSLELNALKWYILQYIEKCLPFFNDQKRFRKESKKIKSMDDKQILQYIPKLLKFGIDPF